MDIDEALERAEELYQGAAERMFRFLKVGDGGFQVIIPGGGLPGKYLWQ